MKQDTNLVGNYPPFRVFLCVSKGFERIIQKTFSSFIDEFLSPYLRGSRKGFAWYALVPLIEKWKKILDIKS